MLRLTTVFLIWIASTACALDGGDADYKAADFDAADLNAELHEAYVSAWNEADHRGRTLLARSQRAWSEYRAANCALLGEHCYALMAQERAAELRLLLDKYERSYYSAADVDRDAAASSRHQR
jgi:uncharacterized protein YecT (DUF1311 family)